MGRILSNIVYRGVRGLLYQGLDTFEILAEGILNSNLSSFELQTRQNSKRFQYEDNLSEHMLVEWTNERRNGFYSIHEVAGCSWYTRRTSVVEATLLLLHMKEPAKCNGIEPQEVSLGHVWLGRRGQWVAVYHRSNRRIWDFFEDKHLIHVCSEKLVKCEYLAVVASFSQWPIGQTTIITFENQITSVW